ncbi:MAG: 3-dehydroquinate synthase [Saprospiraceae bacterium]|nr:3-dehydroquinate synthase [Saprospiraceae bacterium]
MDILNLPTYTIHLGDLRESAGDWLRRQNYPKVAVLVDENTEQHCLPVFLKKTGLADFHLIRIEAGEPHKNIGTCQTIWSRMMESGLDRRSLLINLGGGVIGDMGGFCAATFKRGMDFVQVPTTLLSQVDASVGGKLGIDFMQVKNSIGVFRDPAAVFIDPDFLKTLPYRELRSGFAEMIKHALIADEAQWQKMSRLQDLAGLDWSPYILHSLRIKQSIVEADPFERGIRKALNFGHTIGHAIEGHALESAHPLLHGEAIAVGMVAESYLSHRKLGLPLPDVEAIKAYLTRIYGAFTIEKSSYPDYLALMHQDKKNENGQILFSLIHPVGNAVVNVACEPEDIEAALDYFLM